MFSVPDSSPPSTPNSRYNGNDNPSTTPAGPPPSSLTQKSFTPAGPPPSTIFGSSQLGSAIPSGRPSFQPTGRLASSSFQQPKTGLFSNQPRQKAANTLFSVPASSPPVRASNHQSTGYGQYEDEEYSEEEEDEEDEEEEVYEDDEDMDAEGEDLDDDQDEIERQTHQPSFGRPQQPIPTSFDFGGSVFTSLGKSQFGLSNQSKTFAPAGKASTTTQTRYDFLGLAKGLAASSKQKVVEEPDDLVLETERLLNKLEASAAEGDLNNTMHSLKEVARELQAQWQKTAREVQDAGGEAEPSKLENAIKIASLLLYLYHPSEAEPKADFGGSIFGKSSFARSTGGQRKETPIPRVLLDWLNTYHELFPSDVEVVLEQGRDYSSHPQFWDAVLGSCFRGKLTDTIKLLRGANFSKAITAVDDGRINPGYIGLQLANIEKVIDDALRLLEASPAIRSGSWDIKSSEWNLYRRKVNQAIDSLREFAEGDSYDRDDEDPLLLGQSSAAKGGMGLSVASRKAQSKVPWTIYESLVNVYDHLLGNQTEIMNNAIDWVEAVVGSTVWWDGELDGNTAEDLRASRFSKSRSQRSRAVDISPCASYRRQLAQALATVTQSEDEELSINTSSSLEIGLACVFDGNLEGAIVIIRSLSLPIASAIVEVASAGKWLSGDSPAQLLKNFDKSDLMVLSYGQEDREQSGISKDKILVNYAKVLSRKQTYSSSDGSIVKEGWELAMQVVGRVDDASIADKSIVPLLDSIELDSEKVVDKVLTACNMLGFVDQGRALAESYADELATEACQYGSAIIYYARCRKPKKVFDVLNLLISYSLVTSAAYPPSSALDPKLKALVKSPAEQLNALARIDLDAAKLLSTSLSGYATLRKFYDLRNECAQSPSATKKFKTARQAAHALITVISSASASISGGLYDPSADAVVQVDGLLVLLGESLPLLNSSIIDANNGKASRKAAQSSPIFSLAHLHILMSAVEDLSTAPRLIKQQCEACLSSTLAAFRSGISEPADPRELLRKSISTSLAANQDQDHDQDAMDLEESGSKAASSQFSLVGSSMLLAAGGASGKNSKAKVERGWDWRSGWSGGGDGTSEISGEEVLKVLRLKTVQEVAKAWVEDGEMRW